MIMIYYQIIIKIVIKNKEIKKIIFKWLIRISKEKIINEERL